MKTSFLSLSPMPRHERSLVQLQPCNLGLEFAGKYLAAGTWDVPSNLKDSCLFSVSLTQHGSSQSSLIPLNRGQSLIASIRRRISLCLMAAVTVNDPTINNAAGFFPFPPLPSPRPLLPRPPTTPRYHKSYPL